MADNNGNGVSGLWKFIAASAFTLVVMGMGGVIGHLVTTSVTQNELAPLVKQADKTHEVFAMTYADHEKRIRAVEQAVVTLTAILQERQNGNH